MEAILTQGGEATTSASPVVASLSPAITVSVEDMALVTRCIAGESKAFNELTEKYSPLLLNLLKKMLRDEHRALDAVQDVLVKLWEKRERFSSFRGDCKLSTWLSRIAINTATNIMRGNKRKIDGVRLTKMKPVIESPESELIREENFKAIQEAMEEVPEHLRTVLLQSDESYEDIAARLGLSPGAVRGSLYRARQAFKAALERRG
jgi:RNA polymerase sigma-70 factor, ECF subfamily